MADRRIEWQIALDSAGVSKGVKGIDVELSAMRKAFDSFSRIKAFDAQLTALNDLASKLEAAKAKAAALAPAAETGGKAAQNAYAKAAYEVTRLEQSLRSQTSAVAASAAALDKAGISTEDLAAETARVAEEYKAAAAAAGQAAKSQEAWAATGVRSTKELEAEIAKLQQLTKSGLLDERGIAAAEARIESLNKELGRTPPAAQSGVAGLASLTKGAAGLAAAYLSIESAKQAVAVTAEFGDELQAVAAFSGATAAEMAKLRQNALDLAGAAGGPRAIAAGMADLAASGASASEIMGATGIVRDMAAASKGTLDFAKAGDLLTNVLKMYGKQITDAQPVADRLVTGWSSAGQTAADLEMSIKEVGSTFSNLYGYLGNTAPLEKTIATLSVMAETTFKGEKGGTALKTALKNLIAPAGEAEKTLAKYKDTIKIFDDAGNMRDFADIIDDIGKSGLSSGEMFNLFGDSTAAMTALVNLGGNSIRNMEAKLKSADGTAAKVQTTMQDGLGGGIRQAGAEIEKAAIIFTDQFGPALRATLSLAGYADNVVQGLSGTIKTVAAVTTASYGVIMQLPRAFEAITDTLGITDAKTTVWADNSRTAFAAAAGLGREASAFFKAAAGSVDELAEAQKRLDGINAQVSSRFNEISQATGVTVSTMQELDAAVAAGKIKWDDATSSWIGSEKQKQEAVAKTAVEATAAAEKAADFEKDARKEVEKSWEEYGNQVKKISEEIYNKGRSLDEQLKEMARSGMSAAEAQKAIKKEAEDAYASAARLAETGNFDAALSTAAAAKESWADVAGNVREATEEVEKTKESLAEATEKLGELKAKAGKDGIISESEQESIDNAKES
jgi:TP901 family phage tail tape measure protein